MSILNSAALQLPSTQTFIPEKDKSQALKTILQNEESIQQDLAGGIKKSLIINKVIQKLKSDMILPIISTSDWYDLGILKTVNYSENEHRSFIKCTYELININRLKDFLIQS